MNKYYYIIPKVNTPIYVKAKRRPSIYTMPKSGTWVVYRWYKDNWYMVVPFPEIIWETLRTFNYIGKLKCD